MPSHRKKKRERKEWSALHISKQKVPDRSSPREFLSILINSSISLDVFYQHHQAVFTFVYFDIRMLMSNM